MERLRKSEWRVDTIPMADALRLVEAHHYSKGGALTSVYRHGLIHKETGRVFGVALWMPPTKAAAQCNYTGDFREVLTLSRLAIATEVPNNACSFLLGASERLIRKIGKYKFLLTYADTWQGHTGAIYKATNWDYLGETRPGEVWVDKEGRMMGKKRGPVNLSKAQMEGLGFTLQGKFSKHRFGKLLVKSPQEY